MKTVQHILTPGSGAVSHYAEKLRELVLEAADAGVSLAIPPTEEKADAKKTHPDVRRHVATAVIPVMRFTHPFSVLPQFVTATGFTRHTPSNDVGRSGSHNTLIQSEDHYFDPLPSANNVPLPSLDPAVGEGDGSGPKSV